MVAEVPGAIAPAADAGPRSGTVRTARRMGMRPPLTPERIFVAARRGQLWRFSLQGKLTAEVGKLQNGARNLGRNKE